MVLVSPTIKINKISLRTLPAIALAQARQAGLRLERSPGEMAF
jgi:hypothetical protein